MGPLLVTAFLAGLAGGVHCAAMCGGIVAALSLGGGAARPGAAWRQAAYGIGRLTSYALGGALAGGAGGVLLLTEGLLPARAFLFTAANALVILLGLHLAGVRTTVVPALERGGAAAWLLVKRLGGRIAPARSPGAALLVGLAWGWIPCGLVYSVLATALVSGGPLRGAAVMAAFGAGTLPNLFALGLAAHGVRRVLLAPRARLVAGVAVVLLGVVGLTRVPGLSEHLGHALPAAR